MATTEMMDIVYVDNTTANLTELGRYFDGLAYHPHWEIYSDEIIGIPDIVHYILGIYIALVGIIGTIGNLLVIYIFITTKSLRTPPNMFIINMAISDLGFSAVNGFPLMTISCFLRKWRFGDLACQLYGFVSGIFGFNSINTLAWISLDRYYVIAYPFEAMRKCTHKRALLQILFVWFWATLWSFPPLLGWGAYLPEGFHTACSFDYFTQDIATMTHVWGMFIGGFCVPVLMICVCYINIIRAVSNQAKSMAKTAEKMGAQAAKDEKKQKQEIELAKLAAITISLFLISWLPYAAIALLGITGNTSYVTPYSCQIPVMFAKASAMWNPILYALNHPKFRAVLDERFPFLLMCKGRKIDKDDEESENTKSAGRRGKRGLDSSEEMDSEIETVVDEVPKVAIVAQNAIGQGQTSNPYYNQVQANAQAQAIDASAISAFAGMGGNLQQAAGSAFNSLAEVYVSLKNVTDKLVSLAPPYPYPAAPSQGMDNPAYEGENSLKPKDGDERRNHSAPPTPSKGYFNAPPPVAYWPPPPPPGAYPYPAMGYPAYPAYIPPGMKLTRAGSSESLHSTVYELNRASSSSEIPQTTTDATIEQKPDQTEDACSDVNKGSKAQEENSNNGNNNAGIVLVRQTPLPGSLDESVSSNSDKESDGQQVVNELTEIVCENESTQELDVAKSNGDNETPDDGKVGSEIKEVIEMVTIQNEKAPSGLPEPSKEETCDVVDEKANNDEHPDTTVNISTEPNEELEKESKEESVQEIVEPEQPEPEKTEVPPPSEPEISYDDGCV